MGKKDDHPKGAGVPRKHHRTSHVSEEGLPFGIPDATGKPVDRTDSASVRGQITSKSHKAPVDDWILDAPTTSLTSNGVAIRSTGHGTSTLRALAGTTEVATMSIDHNGTYDFRLMAPVDHHRAGGENIESLDFIARSADKPQKREGLVSIRLEDDSPACRCRSSSPTRHGLRRRRRKPPDGTRRSRCERLVRALANDRRNNLRLPAARPRRGRLGRGKPWRRQRCIRRFDPDPDRHNSRRRPLVVDLDGGQYRFERPPAVGASSAQTMRYVLSDRDGDTVASAVSVRVLPQTAPVFMPVRPASRMHGLPEQARSFHRQATPPMGILSIASMTPLAAPGAPVVA